jgi:pyridoxamine 5'-phosphate oxidase
MDLKDIKLEYIREELNQDDLNKEPVLQLQKWLKEAQKSEISYPNAVTLATVNSSGVPLTRIVLIKEITENGIHIFTDYSSQKGIDIQKNNNVSILFFWKELDRQIRVTGKATKLTLEESKEYFYSRPRESQISALASSQSSVVKKKELLESVETLTKNLEGKKVEYPETWGGYTVSYDSFEFWQGRPNRLHDRFQYEKQDTNWKIDRLSP